MSLKFFSLISFIQVQPLSKFLSRSFHMFMNGIIFSHCLLQLQIIFYYIAISLGMWKNNLEQFMFSSAFTGNLAQTDSISLLLTHIILKVKIMQNILYVSLLSLLFSFFSLYSFSMFANFISNLLSLQFYLQNYTQCLPNLPTTSESSLSLIFSTQIK